MRISEETSYRMMSESLVSRQQIIGALQQQISSGKKILYPSDDPALYEKALNLRSDLSNITQFQKNAETASAELLSVENNLRNATEIFQRAGEITIRGGDSSISSVDRKALANEVDSMLQSLVNQANQNESGRYKYGGLRSNYQPFLVADGNGDGYIDSVTYRGDNKVKNVEIGRGVYVASTMPGSNEGGENAVFVTKTQDLFNELITLRDQLLAGENTVAGEATTADAGSDEFAVSGVYSTGCRVEVSSVGGNVPGGLTAGMTYYAIVTGTGVQLAASLDDARNGVPIDLTSAGTGSISIRKKTLEGITAATEHINDLISKVGARQETIGLQKDMLSSHETLLNTSLANTESIDIAETVMALSKSQTAYEAALKAAAMFINQPRLMDMM